MSETMAHAAGAGDAPPAQAFPTTPAPALWLAGVERRYVQGEQALEILRGADLALWPGQSVALVAPSGVGKSTLLHLAGLLEKPDGGEVYVRDAATSTMSDEARTALRRNHIGFVYQFHHLLPEFSALENIMLPQMIRGLAKREAARRATELLTYLGLGERVHHRPAQLSGGEQQRVGIARATACRPVLLFADEPTGNLDAATGAAIAELMFTQAAASGATLVLITHDVELAKRCDRVIEMRDGRIHDSGAA